MSIQGIAVTELIIDYAGTLTGIPKQKLNLKPGSVMRPDCTSSENDIGGRKKHTAEQGVEQSLHLYYCLALFTVHNCKIHYVR